MEITDSQKAILVAAMGSENPHEWKKNHLASDIITEDLRVLFESNFLKRSPAPPFSSAAETTTLFVVTEKGKAYLRRKWYLFGPKFIKELVNEGGES